MSSYPKFIISALPTCHDQRGTNFSDKRYLINFDNYKFEVVNFANVVQFSHKEHHYHPFKLNNNGVSVYLHLSPLELIFVLFMARN